MVPSSRRTIPYLGPKPPPPGAAGLSGLLPAVALRAEGILDEGTPSPCPFPDLLGAPDLEVLQAHTEEGDSALGRGDFSSYLAFIAMTERERVGSVLQKAVGRRDGVCCSKQARQNVFADF